MPERPARLPNEQTRWMMLRSFMWIALGTAAGAALAASVDVPSAPEPEFVAPAEPVPDGVPEAVTTEDYATATAPSTMPVSVPTMPTLRAPREAALDAQARFGGRVLSLRLEQDSYRVKLLKDGAVRVVRVPAR